MKTIGLIGGMSWESTQEYYRIFNRYTNKLLGGHHSCKCIIHSVNFQEIVKMQHEQDHPAMLDAMIIARDSLKKAGADIIMIGTNTMHQYYEDLTKSFDIPFLHIAEACGEKMLKQNIKKPLILGTRFTMEGDFYTSFLEKHYSFQTMIPELDDRKLIHKIIYKELVKGSILEESKKLFLSIIHRMAVKGADAVVLGCTEIPLLIQQDDLSIPVFNTTEIHATKAVELALNK